MFEHSIFSFFKKPSRLDMLRTIEKYARLVVPINTICYIRFFLWPSDMLFICYISPDLKWKIKYITEEGHISNNATRTYSLTCKRYL